MNLERYAISATCLLLFACKAEDFTGQPTTDPPPQTITGSTCSTVKIDFEDAVVNRAEIYDDYADLGALFYITEATNLPRYIMNHNDPTDMNPTSGLYGLGGNPNAAFSDAYPLTVEFIEPVGKVSVYVIDAEANGAYVSFQDTQRVEYERIFIAPGVAGNQKLAKTNFAGIRYMVVASYSGDGIYVDDVTYEVCE